VKKFLSRHKRKYLIQDLIETISYENDFEDDENGEVKEEIKCKYEVDNGNQEKQNSLIEIVTACFTYPLGIIGIVLFLGTQLPFLIPANIFKWIFSLVVGIRFSMIPPLLPAKRIDLINNKIKIEIRHNEHPPPHFHVIIDNSDLSYSILTGELLKGSYPNRKYLKSVDNWYKKNQKVLVKHWNETRPSNCSVGKIKTNPAQKT